MISYPIYVCEKCNKKSKNKHDIIQCEANHYGLTIDEYNLWHKLKISLRNVKYSIGITELCPESKLAEKLYNDAKKDLENFENNKNIGGINMEKLQCYGCENYQLKVDDYEYQYRCTATKRGRQITYHMKTFRFVGTERVYDTEEYILGRMDKYIHRKPPLWCPKRKNIDKGE